MFQDLCFKNLNEFILMAGHKVILPVLLVAVCTLREVGTTDSPCMRQQTCSQCLREPGCAWCARPLDKNISNYENRCYHRRSKQDYCKKYTVDMKNKLNEIEAEPLSKKHSLKHIQITPQKISLKLRVNTPTNITINFRETDDLPLDLYYLMDVSRSMEDDILTLRKLGEGLSTNMRRITSKFQLGFGTFVDKTVLPIITPDSNKNRENGDRPAYGFRHHLKLTQDSSLFTETVNKIDYANAFTINDDPEGGLDALLQALVCKKEIGWRDDARRLVLFSTDSESHMAGVGRFAGLDLPNDGLCHLNSLGEYDHSNLQDYPSVSLINTKVIENKIIVIFAVPEYIKSFYQMLSSEIVGSTVADLLYDSSNIVQLIEKEYKTLKSSVEMKIKSSDPVKVSLFSSCGQGTTPQRTTKCKELPPETDITFTAQLELTNCPSDPSHQRQTVEISPVGLNQTLIVDVEMICNCRCEQLPEEGFERNSSVCSHAGSYQCGVCVCDPNRAGHKCECDSSKYREGSDNTTTCRSNTDSQDCSGQGHCVCGQCVCNHISDSERFYGKFCECDNFSCERYNQRLCNGHGTCDCGTCRCEAEWQGSACECPTSPAQCMPPTGGNVCSGHGHCKCGQCMCDKDPKGKYYYGRFCESCSSCSERCEEVRPCVECLVHGTGPLSSTCQTNCSNLKYTTDHQLIEDEAAGENLCMFEDENGCSIRFVYLVDFNGELVVRALKNKKCPPTTLVVLLGIGALVLFTGVAALVLWKVITMYHDRKEFIKFQKEVFLAKWAKGENPLYHAAVTSFANPTYSQNEEERP